VETSPEAQSRSISRSACSGWGEDAAPFCPCCTKVWDPPFPQHPLHGCGSQRVSVSVLMQLRARGCCLTDAAMSRVLGWCTGAQEPSDAQRPPLPRVCTVGRSQILLNANRIIKGITALSCFCRTVMSAASPTSPAALGRQPMPQAKSRFAAPSAKNRNSQGHLVLALPLLVHPGEKRGAARH